MTRTFMRTEIEAIPAAVERLLIEQHDALAAAGAALAARDPALIATIARGSSDHASSYLKYAFELVARRPVASLGPSIASIYGVDLDLSRAAAIATSQSGKSPDLVAMLESSRRGGALTVAITNDVASPLADVADHVLDISAGPEKSVAATKTFVTSIVAGLALLANWQDDSSLKGALAALPEQLAAALALDWSPLSAYLVGQNSVYVLGRGPGTAIASEAALKFKETSGLHAEAYSTAEVLHGPSAIVTDGFPALVFALADKARDSVLGTAEKLARQGGRIFVTDTGVEGTTALPVVRTGHPLTEPLALAITYYGFVEAFSRSRGHNPDAPPLLNKVTSTR